MTEPAHAASATPPPSPPPAPRREVSPLLLLITAPSGVGKTTVGDNLLATVPGLVRAVTCTTRAPRGAERNGVDYHFLDRPTFERQIAEGAFLEHAEVYGNRYGTRRAEILDRLAGGQDVLLSVDVQGAAAIRESAERDPILANALVSVFFMPPSLAELQRRLTGRNQDSAEAVARRLAMARSEMEYWHRCDYVLVSGTREEDRAAMESILRVEKLRTRRTPRLDIH